MLLNRVESNLGNVYAEIRSDLIQQSIKGCTNTKEPGYAK